MRDLLLLLAAAPFFAGLAGIVLSLLVGGSTSGGSGGASALAVTLRLSGIVLLPAPVVLMLLSTVSTPAGAIAPVVGAATFTLLCGLAGLVFALVPKAAVMRVLQRLMDNGGLVPANLDWQSPVMITVRLFGGYYAAFGITYALTTIR